MIVTCFVLLEFSFVKVIFLLASPLWSITPPKAPVFEGTLTTDAPPASEEKGMSIPVIGSSECIVLVLNIPFLFLFFFLIGQVSG